MVNMWVKLWLMQISLTSGESRLFENYQFFVLIADRIAKFALYNTILLIRPLHLDENKTERRKPQSTLNLPQNIVNKMNDYNTKALFNCRMKTNMAEIVNLSIPQKFTVTFCFYFVRNSTYYPRRPACLKK